MLTTIGAGKLKSQFHEWVVGAVLCKEDYANILTYYKELLEKIDNINASIYNSID